jgi:hypothetical protein
LIAFLKSEPSGTTFQTKPEPVAQRWHLGYVVPVSYEPFDRFLLNAALKAQKSSAALYTIARANKEAVKMLHNSHYYCHLG